MKKERIYKVIFSRRALLIAGVTLVLLLQSVLGFKVRTLSVEQKEYKEAYAFVNNASYGLLSVDSWRDQIVSAAKEEVGDYRLTKEQKTELKKEIEQVLRAVVDHAFQVINRKQSSLRGKLRKFVVKTFVNRDKIEAKVPGMANQLVAEITHPDTYRKLSTVADSALSQVGKSAYDSSVAATHRVMDSVYQTIGVKDRAAFDTKINTRLAKINEETYRYAMGMLGCVIAILLLWVLLRNQRRLHVPLYLLSVVSAMILLAVGLTTTMIEIDARIAKMDLHFLDKTISFKDQGLFFQSKSIVDVVMLLLETNQWTSQVVGVLILVFSVLFPFMKLSSTGVALMSEHKWGKNRVIRYFAFESGKWSMADVIVIAILMTYIGFNGIVTSTLKTLNYHQLPITSISTTHTTIQPGYIIFISFVIYGFVLSAILKRITKGYTVQ